MNDNSILFILGINFILVICFCVYMCIWKKNRHQGLMLSLFMLVTPIVGAVFLIIAALANKIFFRQKDDLLSEEELSFSKKRTRMIISDDLEKEEDVVPLDEALRISDTMNRRQAFLEVLKRGDVEDYTSGICSAMSQEDTEVVHYAASYITDTIAKYKENERRLRELCAKENSVEVLQQYLSFCGNILRKNIFTQPEEQRYLEFYEIHMEELYQMDKDKVDGVMMSQLLELKKKDTAADKEKWILRAKEKCATDIDACKMVLKYYYEKQDKEKFLSALEEIKQSDLVLDSELLEWIRFFS